MTMVYLLINCTMGYAEKIIDELKQIESMKGIQGVFGMYDVLVKVESSEEKILNQTVLAQIQKIEHIQSVQTLIVSE